MDYITLHHPGFDLSSEDCLYLNIYVPKVSENVDNYIMTFCFVIPN